MATSPSFAATPHTEVTKFEPADTTTRKTIFTAASGGSRIESISAISNDNAIRRVLFYLTNGGVDFLLGFVTLPATTSTIPIVSAGLLNSQVWLQSMDLGLVLSSGFTIRANIESTITAGREITILAVGGDM